MCADEEEDGECSSSNSSSQRHRAPAASPPPRQRLPSSTWGAMSAMAGGTRAFPHKPQDPRDAAEVCACLCASWVQMCSWSVSRAHHSASQLARLVMHACSGVHTQPRLPPPSCHTCAKSLLLSLTAAVAALWRGPLKKGFLCEMGCRDLESSH